MTKYLKSGHLSSPAMQTYFVSGMATTTDFGGDGSDLPKNIRCAPRLSTCIMRRSGAVFLLIICYSTSLVVHLAASMY